MIPVLQHMLMYVVWYCFVMLFKLIIHLLEAPMEYLAKLLWNHWCDVVITREAISRYSSLFANLLNFFDI